MVSAAGVTTRRRDGDGAIPGREGGDVIRREGPEGQEKREKGAAGINAIRGVGGNVWGGEGGGERWCEGGRVGAECVDFARG